MSPEVFAAMALKELAELVVSLLKQGRVNEALDASEELARRIAFEEAQRAKARGWLKIFGKK